MQLRKATKGVGCLQLTQSLMKVYTRRQQGVPYCWQREDEIKTKDLSWIWNHLRETKTNGSTFWKDKEISVIPTLFIALCHSVMFFLCALVNWSHDLFLVAASNTLQMSSPVRNSLHPITYLCHNHNSDIIWKVRTAVLLGLNPGLQTIQSELMPPLLDTWDPTYRYLPWTTPANCCQMPHSHPSLRQPVLNHHLEQGQSGGDWDFGGEQPGDIPAILNQSGQPSTLAGLLRSVKIKTAVEWGGLGLGWTGLLEEFLCLISQTLTIDIAIS